MGMSPTTPNTTIIPNYSKIKRKKSYLQIVGTYLVVCKDVEHWVDDHRGFGENDGEGMDLRIELNSGHLQEADGGVGQPAHEEGHGHQGHHQRRDPLPPLRDAPRHRIRLGQRVLRGKKSYMSLAEHEQRARFDELRMK